MHRRIAIALLSLACSTAAAGARAADLPAGGTETQGGAVKRLAELTTSGIEAVGIAVIVLGATVATLAFLRDGLSAPGWGRAYERYRANLGRGILIGLELLVAADIVGTVAAPMDLRTVGALALIVLIRTFLSFSLEVEIKGRWPWQEGRAPRAGPSSDA